MLWELVRELARTHRITIELNYPQPRPAQPNAGAAAMNWTDQHTAEMDKIFAAMSDQRKAEIDVKAAMLFCNLQILGLASESLPATVPQLKPEHVAKFRQLAILVDTACAFIHQRQAAASN